MFERISKWNNNKRNGAGQSSPKVQHTIASHMYHKNIIRADDMHVTGQWWDDKQEWRLDVLSCRCTCYSNTPPQVVCSPSWEVKCFTLGKGRAFVKVSVIILPVGQNINHSFPSLITHQIKWKCMSICSVHVWYWWSFVRAIADWLSEKRVVGSVMGLKRSLMSDCSHRASFAAWVAAMYSLSVVKSKTISCCFDDQDTVPPSIKKAYLV